MYIFCVRFDIVYKKVKEGWNRSFEDFCGKWGAVSNSNPRTRFRTHPHFLSHRTWRMTYKSKKIKIKRASHTNVVCCPLVCARPLVWAPAASIPPTAMKQDFPPGAVEPPKAARGMGSGEGVYPLPGGVAVWGGGCAPSPEKFCIFSSKNTKI